MVLPGGDNGCPAAVVALIAGWVTTEVGRQPWVVYGVMRTEQAVTGADGIVFGFAALLAVYIALIGTVFWVLRRIASQPFPPEIAALEEDPGAESGEVNDGAR